VPVSEVLRVALGVLQRSHELKAAFEGLAVPRVAGHVADLARHPTRLGEAFRIRRRSRVGDFLDGSTVRPALETAVPRQAAWVDLVVLQAAYPVVHLEHQIGK